MNPMGTRCAATLTARCRSMIVDMGRRAIIATLALVAVSTAAAEGPSVVIYGRLYPQLTYARTSGATAADAQVSTLVAPPAGASRSQHFEVQAANSRLGLRGKEALAGDLDAIWQIEQQVSIDSGGSALASRDTFLGLQGTYGSIRLGNLDTVYKTIGDTLSFLGVSSGNFVSDSEVLSKCGIGTSSACSFHLRRGNSIRYDSAAVGGIEVQLQWSPDEQKTAARDARLMSSGVAFTRGPLYLAVGYEVHDDFFGGSRNVRSDLSNFADPAVRARDYGLRGAAKYDFGRHEIEFDAARLAYRESGGQRGRFQSYTNEHFGFSWRARWSATLRTQMAYVQALAGRCALAGGAACSTAGVDARQLSIGATYDFSRRTYAYLIGAKLWNGFSARYNNLENGAPDAGADITQVALGLAMSF